MTGEQVLSVSRWKARYQYNVVGERDLVVLFDGAFVSLNDVLFLEKMSHPLLLGIDLVANGNILISGFKEVNTVTVQNQPKPDIPASIEDMKKQTERFTIDDVKQKSAEIGDSSDEDDSLPGPDLIEEIVTYRPY